MIRKHDNLNEQKYCYGNHHCPLTSASIIPLVLLLAVLTPLVLQGRISTTQRKEGVGNWGLCGREVLSVLLLSDGCVPEHSCLRRVRGWTDLFGPAAFPPGWEDRRTFLLALTPLLVPVLVPVQRRRPLRRSLQMWMLSGADLHAESAFPLDLF